MNGVKLPSAFSVLKLKYLSARLMSPKSVGDKNWRGFSATSRDIDNFNIVKIEGNTSLYTNHKQG